MNGGLRPAVPICAPGRHDFDLFLCVITVNLETPKIVRDLPHSAEIAPSIADELETALARFRAVAARLAWGPG